MTIEEIKKRVKKERDRTGNYLVHYHLDLVLIWLNRLTPDTRADEMVKWICKRIRATLDYLNDPDPIVGVPDREDRVQRLQDWYLFLRRFAPEALDQFKSQPDPWQSYTDFVKEMTR